MDKKIIINDDFAKMEDALSLLNYFCKKNELYIKLLTFINAKVGYIELAKFDKKLKNSITIRIDNDNTCFEYSFSITGTNNKYTKLSVQNNSLKINNVYTELEKNLNFIYAHFETFYGENLW